MFIHRTKRFVNLFRTIASPHYYFGIIKFHLPDLGEKIKQGTIKQLYIKEGDTVQEFQKLADVSSDKQFTQITASNAGVIKKIYYKEQQVCQVGDLFLQIMEKDGEEGSESAPEAAPAQQAPKQKQQEHHKVEIRNIDGGIFATPYVRGLIKSYGLDINKIRGTGIDGRILEKDVENLINRPKAPQQHTEQPRRQVPPPSPSPPTRSAPSSQISGTKSVSMSSYQKGMQKSMTQSNTIPHLYLHQQFDITQVQKMRKVLKESNKKVTVMGILVKTFSLAIKQNPKMNSVYNPSVNPFQYSIHPNHNVSIAIDSPNGLVVPHIKNVNNISLLDIQAELQRLRNLASQAKLSAKELVGGTICLSNIGTIGGTHACPLILPPQVCIVAIGKLQSVPKYRGGELVERKVLNVTYGCDHRVLDGATVARFSNSWKQLIQNPYLSMAEMI